MSKKYNIVVMHLDLGIGGAEQLIVTISRSLLEMGHNVEIITSHHDVNHCFEDTKPNGVLGKSISVHGDWLPRNFLRKFTAFFAILRMIFLAIIIAFTRKNIDLVILDGVSAPIPLLKLFGLKVLFYCHFPDLLLCTDRSNILKKFYRFFLDWFEEATTRRADKILVNSGFTAEVFKEVFPSIFYKKKPSILYPVVEKIPDFDYQLYRRNNLQYLEGYQNIFVSVNRYERKKKIEIAINAMKLYLDRTELAPNKGKSVLIVAGGYDLRVEENVEYHKELQRLCDKLNLKYEYISELGNPDTMKLAENGVRVIFRTSIPSFERNTLFKLSNALLYTPDKEHFGIVPLEAMSLGLPVIAVNSGGPTESVAHYKTGFLCNQDPAEFAQAMWELSSFNVESGKVLKNTMKVAAITWVETKFSIDALKRNLNNYIHETTTHTR